MKTPNLKKDLKDELAEIKQPIEAISKKLEELDALCGDMCHVDDFYSELSEDLKKEQKLTKKQAREKARAILKEKMPNFLKTLETIDLLVESMEDRIQETLDNFEYIEELLGDVENAKDNLEAEVDDL